MTIQTTLDDAVIANFAIISRQQSQDIGDNGKSNDLKVYRVTKFTMRPVSERHFGTFWDGDSYVIKYTFVSKETGNRQSITYLWLGAHSSPDEVGTAALKGTWEFSSITQIRIDQGKETDHFMRLFNKKIIILRGGVQSGFRSTNSIILPFLEDSNDDTPKRRLLHVKCDQFSEPDYVRVVEVQCTAEMLNTNDTFVLVTEAGTYLWFGKGCDATERGTARTVADTVDRGMLIGTEDDDYNIVDVEESQEPDEFWDAIGGRADYASGHALQTTLTQHPTRLFQMTRTAANFAAIEIKNFIQGDLNENYTMMLDTWDDVFLWVGAHSSEVHRKHAILASVEYLRQQGREDVQIVMIKQASEPRYFTCHFHLWDYRIWSGGRTYSERCASLTTVDLPTSLDVALQKYTMKYSYWELRNNSPEGVDMSYKEDYLEGSEFEYVFQMTRSEYNEIPVWRQQELKKEVGLF